MNNCPIGVFDSGVGGLMVLAEIKRILPNEDFIYLGDSLNFPYGPKSKEQIIEFSKNNVQFLISRNVKAIVIACGTATSQALTTLKNWVNVPIIGVIEPVANYVKKLNLSQVRSYGNCWYNK